MKSNDSLADLSESELLQCFGDLIRQDQRRTAQLLAVIAEIDERKLWAKHACSSMFAFCVERFHMSESMTAKRIWAARTARRFPAVLRMVARGELHLSGIQQLAKHLNPDNHRALLGYPEQASCVRRSPARSSTGCRAGSATRCALTHQSATEKQAAGSWHRPRS